MVARKAWRLYMAYWPELVTACVFAILLYGVVALVAALVMAPLLGEAGAGGKLILPSVLVGIVWLAVAPLATGGLYSSVVRALRGELPGPADLWQAGLRYWGRFLALCVFHLPVGLLLFAAWALLWRLHPAVGVAFVILLAAPALVVTVGYAQYIAIWEDKGAGAAISRAARIVVSRPGDLIMTTVVVACGTLVVGVVGFFAGEIPVAGPVLQLLLVLVWAPYSLLYLAVRYEMKIAPALSPMGGEAVFHANPPPGAGV